MSSIDDEIAKLETQVSRGAAVDRRARAADAAALLRQAMDIVSGELRPSSALQQAGIHMLAAADFIDAAIGKGDL